MNRYLLLCIILFFSLLSNAQSFRMQIDSTYFHIPDALGYPEDRIVKCADGGIAIISFTYDNALASAVKLVKLDSIGTVEWCKVYGSWYDVFEVNIVATVDSGFCLSVSEVYPSPVWDERFDLLKLDKFGNKIIQKSSVWSNGSNAGRIYWMQKEKFGPYINAFWGQPGGSAFFAKLDTSLNLVFSKSLSNGFSSGLTLDSGGVTSGYLIAGLDKTIFPWRVSLSKLDTLGNYLWSKSYTGNNYQNSIRALEQVDSAFYALEMGVDKIGIRKVDFNGNTLFLKYIDSSFNSLPSDSYLRATNIFKNDSNHLLISYIYKGKSHLIEIDMQGNITKGFKSVEDLYTGASFDPISNAFYLTSRDSFLTMFGDSKIIFEKEYIHNLTCDYESISFNVVSALTYDSVIVSSNFNELPQLAFNFLDTLSKPNVVSIPICTSVVPGFLDLDSKLNQLTVYPNPASSRLYIIGSDFITEAHLEIFNSNGSKIYSSVFNGSEEIDCSKFARGLHFIRITNDDSIISRLFILE